MSSQARTRTPSTPARKGMAAKAATKVAATKAKAVKATKAVKAVKATKAGAAAANEPVPLLIYVPRRVRERLNKLVRTREVKNQGQLIADLVNAAYRE